MGGSSLLYSISLLLLTLLIRWAVEENKAAAKAFGENHPEATVFTEDCRELLKKAKNGFKKNFFSEKTIPAKEEVDLLCGGPPCQVTKVDFEKP